MTASQIETYASNAYSIGRFSVKFIIRDTHFEAMWSPRVPPRGALSRKLVARYVRVRHEFLESYALKTGNQVVVVDL